MNPRSLLGEPALHDHCWQCQAEQAGSCREDGNQVGDRQTHSAEALAHLRDMVKAWGRLLRLCRKEPREAHCFSGRAPFLAPPTAAAACCCTAASVLGGCDCGLLGLTCEEPDP